MKQVQTLTEIRDARAALNGSVGFVPTMGALHEGHLSLVKQSRDEVDHTIVSIYVNPTQFNNPNDLANYPDTMARDLELLEEAGVGLVFLPDYALLYPDDYAYCVDEKVLSQTLCGQNRPGHFTGVMTVVMKLLNLVKADKAYFGEKDFQQLRLIQGMAQAFFIETEIVGCPIVREADGLAMSSRNLNLADCDRNLSPDFHKILDSAGDDREVATRLESAGFKVDYVQTMLGRRFGAVVLGSEQNPVRLIDNVVIE